MLFAQGLKFRGSDYSIDKRTSYNVFNESPCFTDSFSVEFDIQPDLPIQIGYIFRIRDKFSDAYTYNLFYDGQGTGNSVLRFNEEGKNSLIRANLPKEKFPLKRWVHVKVFFHLNRDSIHLSIGDETFSVEVPGLPEKYNVALTFGKSDYLIDVPSFEMVNLSVGNGKNMYSFPLNESEGEQVHDQNKKETGNVVNPEWFVNSYYHWKFISQFKSENVSAAGYEQKTENIYYFNRHSMLTYNVRTESVRNETFPSPCPVKLTLGTSFIDAELQKLYAYEVYYDKYPLEDTTVACLDLANMQWITESKERLPRQLHHHGAYFDSRKQQYTLFGGFGNMHYSKDFHVFDLNSKTWQNITFTGDSICPRYFSSVGYSPDSSRVYIFGGMGNESGEQVVGRKYYYDLYQIDLPTNRIRKLWEIKWEKDNMIPVRSMVVPNDSCFYTLCYPEYVSNSFLRLYRFSIQDGNYEILGDSIPFHSDKITTNANIYLDPKLNNLYALLQEFEDDVINQLKIYSLSFPPVSEKDLFGNASKQKKDYLTIVLVVCVFAVAVILLYCVFGRKIKGNDKEEQAVAGEYPSNKSESENENESENESPVNKPDSIFLFGDFSVRNRQNREINYLFSAKLKQVFFLILQHSLEGGISSQHLSSFLWPDRPENKIKNLRGVTINHLRKVLEELDGIQLIYEKGAFKLVINAPCHCDFVRCMEILDSENPDNVQNELLDIVYRGKFLKSCDLQLFDTFKGAVENRLEPLLVTEMEKCFTAGNYQKAVHFAEALLNIDSLSDEALATQIKSLVKLDMKEEAKTRFRLFSSEYKKTIGSNYPQTFADLVK
jgi:two-component SAPR family response regulator